MEVKRFPLRSLNKVVVLVMLLPLAASFTYGTGAVFAANPGNCDGQPRNSQDTIWKDVTNNPYYINETIAFTWAVPMYPCNTTGSGAGQFDNPAILGANLESDDGSNPYLVQLGFGRCDACGWGSQVVMGWTPSDTSRGAPAVATWWNQGLGPGVVQLGHEYETAIAAVGSQWEYAVRDLSGSNTWTYHFVANHWSTKLGGNVAWWGSETNNWQSVMGHLSVDSAYYMNTMEWRESDNDTWHQMTPNSCVMSSPEPSWYYCTAYTGILDSLTWNH